MASARETWIGGKVCTALDVAPALFLEMLGVYEHIITSTLDSNNASGLIFYQDTELVEEEVDGKFRLYCFFSIT